MKNLRERLMNGDVLFGCFLSLGSPLTAEIVGLAGFDWLLIDLEHGAGAERDVIGQMQAVEHTPSAVVVRVESHQRQRIHRVLDMGACGIMAPRVDSAEEARHVVAAMRYPPEGCRGVAQMIRAAQFGSGFPAYSAAANKTLLGIVQIESEEGLQRVDEIAAVDGADVLFVGPSDLTMAMGILGQFDHPRYIEALRLVTAAAARHGKTAGILIRTPEELAKYRELGYRFIGCGSDGGLLNAAARRTAAALSDARRAQ